jgi:hypothetical protein
MSHFRTQAVFGVTSIFPLSSVKSQANSLQRKNDLSIAIIPAEGSEISDSPSGKNDGAVNAVRLDRKLVIEC